MPELLRSLETIENRYRGPAKIEGMPVIQDKDPCSTDEPEAVSIVTDELPYLFAKYTSSRSFAATTKLSTTPPLFTVQYCVQHRMQHRTQRRVQRRRRQRVQHRLE
eukprot:gene297-biopygen6029